VKVVELAIPLKITARSRKNTDDSSPARKKKNPHKA
jgi:hypothetical protein